MYKHHAHIMFFPFYSIQGFPLLQVCSSWSEKIHMDNLGEQLTAQPFEVKTGVRQKCLINFFQTRSKVYKPASRISPEFNQSMLPEVYFKFWQVIVFFAMPFILFQNFFTYMQYRLWKRSHSCKYNFGQKFMRIAL